MIGLRLVGLSDRPLPFLEFIPFVYQQIAMNRRQFLGALGTSATVLSGCTARSIGNEPDESPTPTDTQPTSADTQRKLNSVQLTITGDSVAPGETAKLAITG